MFKEIISLFKKKSNSIQDENLGFKSENSEQPLPDKEKVDFSFSRQEIEKYINPNKNLILKTAHPSPLSAYRGFFKCKHFSKTNDYLVEQGKQPVDWNLA